MIILAIETSCDDTGVASFDTTRGLLRHGFASQVTTHQPYGGVVPELAARDHIRHLKPLVQKILADSRLEVSDVDYLAYTAGPGLAGALLVGTAVAQGLAYSIGVPVIPVHHMEGHLLAVLLEVDKPAWPFVALLVSGGHTLLTNVRAVGDYRILGESLDDAVGEAFDKTAKLLSLPYPGGPSIEKIARKGRPGRFRFPRPMTDRPGLDFSFSGLKTFVRNVITDLQPLDEQTGADIALAFQDAIVETLVIKCRRALRQTNSHRLVVAGGVSANQALRQALVKLAADENARVYYPAMEFCTDNAAMIAIAASKRLSDAVTAGAFAVRPRWRMDELHRPD